MPGFTGTAPPREQIPTVATVNGSVRLTLGEQHQRVLPKARLWLLEDAALVLCVPDKTAPGRVRRERYEWAAAAHWHERSKILTVTLCDLDGGAVGTVELNAKGCGCGMGAAGNAGPTESRHFDVVRVRQPEWYTVTVD